ncbi:MAG TPA: S8/S53 family peptidase, partial [Jatrophihabitans sp.]|nr:S8/S53 family peptidase [Jatrophihabitans sp.]
AEYGVPGHGGRSPVAWVGPAPYRRADSAVGGRRPVVAILDTGVGDHPWLGPDIVHRNPLVDGQPIGLTDAATDPESPEVRDNPLIGTLGADSGHGTFIAGLIRQSCPDADVLAVRIMQADGVVSEGDLIEALNKLWLRQLLALQQGDAASLIDVVSLSLGYYHEQPADAAFDPLLLTPLRALSQLGVAVVASAGNDASLRPMYPAAFAPYAGGAVPAPEPDAVPLTAVGALNPGGTVALFSNEGPWVTCKRPGSALVSTIPIGFDAAGQPTFQTTYDDEVRETLDPDDFRSGFAIWSGTSFAAPILAGEIVQALLDGPAGSLDQLDAASAVTRTLAALAVAAPPAGQPAATARSTQPQAAGTVPVVSGGQRLVVSVEGGVSSR